MCKINVARDLVDAIFMATAELSPEQVRPIHAAAEAAAAARPPNFPCWMGK
jgi:hypothetical protein